MQAWWWKLNAPYGSKWVFFQRQLLRKRRGKLSWNSIWNWPFKQDISFQMSLWKWRRPFCSNKRGETAAIALDKESEWEKREGTLVLKKHYVTFRSLGGRGEKNVAKMQDLIWVWTIFTPPTKAGLWWQFALFRRQSAFLVSPRKSRRILGRQMKIVASSFLLFLRGSSYLEKEKKKEK